VIGISVIVLVLAAQLSPAAHTNDDRYRPHVSGEPAGVITGTLHGYGEGMASGHVDVRTPTGFVKFYTAAAPFVIDGRRIACPHPPGPPSYRRNPEVCFRWPSYVKVGVTRVRIPYWKGTRYGKPTLVARGLTVVK
jgi:hypothetical protein